MICEFAEISFKICGVSDSTEHFLKDFISSKSPDEEILLLPEDIKKESEISGCFDRKILEITALYRKIAEIAPKYGAFLMHAAVIEADKKGLAFTAASGTGKTTHILNWVKCYKDRVRIVNGDKPLIKISGEKIFAYPTPWCGKEKLSGSEKCELKAVGFIKRAEETRIEKTAKKQALRELLNRIYLPADKNGTDLTFALINKFLENCEFFDIFCTKDASSAVKAHDFIFNEEKL